MPPPRAKLHNSTGRKKNLYNNSSSSSSIPTQENRVNTNTANNSNTRNSGNIRSDVPTASRTIATTTDTPAIEQFELELCWCIQTLENSLNSGKLNSKQGKFFSLAVLIKRHHRLVNKLMKRSECVQNSLIILIRNTLNSYLRYEISEQYHWQMLFICLAQDSEKTLRSLKSHNQPMVKKRQLMQLAFGDYRRKMADEEKKLRGGQYQQFIYRTFLCASSIRMHFLRFSSHFDWSFK